jgi:hypothetical protein
VGILVFDQGEEDLSHERLGSEKKKERKKTIERKKRKSTCLRDC